MSLVWTPHARGGKVGVDPAHVRGGSVWVALSSVIRDGVLSGGDGAVDPMGAASERCGVPHDACWCQPDGCPTLP